MKNLTDQTFLITGAGRGLGRQIAEALGALGANIAVNDINPDSAAETARRVVGAGGQASVYTADVSKKFPVQALFNAIEDDWGQLHTLINNARVVPHKATAVMDEWDWRRTLDVNLTGAFVLTQIASRVMQAHGSGRIIQLRQKQPDEPGLAAFQASYEGLKGFGEVAAEELQSSGIEYTTIHYGDQDHKQAVAQILALL